MIKAIFWDIGGVLSRTMDRAPRTRLAERLGLSYAALEEIAFDVPAQRGEIRAEAAWRATCLKVGLPLEQVDAFRSEFFAGDVLDTTLVDYIRSLRPRYRTGIISNAMDDVRPLVEGPWQMADAFDAMIFSAEVGVMKPDARIFQCAMQALKVQPQEAVFVDDFPRNLTGAQALGMQTVHFRSPEQAIAELEALLARQQ